MTLTLAPCGNFCSYDIFRQTKKKQGENFVVSEKRCIFAKNLRNMMAKLYLDPKADLTFKRVFGEHSDLVISLLNALLPFQTKEEEIQSVEYLIPEMVPDNPPNMRPMRFSLSASSLHLAKICFLSIVLTCVNVLTSAATTLAELQAQNELLQVRSKVNFLSLCVVISVMMIFFIWGLRVRHRQGMMLLERKNRALQRTNRLVEEARDEAERQSKKKTVYTQNLAHEIRTPLNQMYGFVQLLADESMPLDDEQRREVIQGIHEGCEQLTRVVLEIDTVAAKLDEMDSLMKVESVLK